MSNAVIAAVRTAVQAGVAYLVAWLTARGIEVDSALLEGAAMSVAIGAVTLLLNKAQVRWPILGTILSFGLSKATPTYE